MGGKRGEIAGGLRAAVRGKSPFYLSKDLMYRAVRSTLLVTESS